MLGLLDMHTATMVALKSYGKIEDIFKRDIEIVHSEDYQFFMVYLTNAIESGSLPAVMKEDSNKENKEFLNKAGISDELQKFAERRKTYWVLHTDLNVYMESWHPKYIGNQWSHARSVLARISFLMAKKLNITDDLLGEVLQLVEDAGADEDTEANELNVEGLGESTVKSCVREISEAGESMVKNE